MICLHDLLCIELTYLTIAPRRGRTLRILTFLSGVGWKGHGNNETEVYFKVCREGDGGGEKWLLNLVSNLLGLDATDTYPPSELTVALPTKKRNKFGCSPLNSCRCSWADANAFSLCGCC